MSRRTHGPKRRAERYARARWPNVGASDIRAALVGAYMKGYNSAIRGRRKRVLKPTDEE